MGINKIKVDNIIKKKQGASINLLPNELLKHILLSLPSIWWFICKFVCSRRPNFPQNQIDPSSHSQLAAT